METNTRSSVLFSSKIHCPHKQTEEPYSNSHVFNYEVCEQSQKSPEMNAGSTHDLKLNVCVEVGRALMGAHMTSLILEGHPHYGAENQC